MILHQMPRMRLRTTLGCGCSEEPFQLRWSLLRCCNYSIWLLMQHIILFNYLWCYGWPLLVQHSALGSDLTKTPKLFYKPWAFRESSWGRVLQRFPGPFFKAAFLRSPAPLKRGALRPDGSHVLSCDAGLPLPLPGLPLVFGRLLVLKFPNIWYN